MGAARHSGLVDRSHMWPSVERAGASAASWDTWSTALRSGAQFNMQCNRHGVIWNPAEMFWVATRDVLDATQNRSGAAVGLLGTICSARWQPRG